MFSDPLLSLIVRQLIIAIGNVTIFYLIVLFIFWLFKIKNPSIRYFFLVIPLVKGLSILTRESVGIVGRPRGALFVTFRLANPLFIPRAPLDIDSFNLATFAVPKNSWYLGASLFLLLLAVSFLIWRAYLLWRFNRLLANAIEIDAIDSVLYEGLGKLIDKTGISQPKLKLANTSAAPFTVGMSRPVIVLSPSLINNLEPKEMEAVLAHEVAHIARRDYIYHWIIVAARDLMYFNPAVHLIFNRLSWEKERACDQLGSRLTHPYNLAQGLIKLAELRWAEPDLAYTRSFAPQNLIRRQNSRLSARVKALLEPPAPKNLSRLYKLLMVLIAIFLLFSEIHLGTFLVKPFLFFS